MNSAKGTFKTYIWLALIIGSFMVLTYIAILSDIIYYTTSDKIRYTIILTKSDGNIKKITTILPHDVRFQINCYKLKHHRAILHCNLDYRKPGNILTGGHWMIQESNVDAYTIEKVEDL